MIAVTAEWLTPNDNGPAHTKFIGGLIICLAGEDGTKDYAPVQIRTSYAFANSGTRMERAREDATQHAEEAHDDGGRSSGR